MFFFCFGNNLNFILNVFEVLHRPIPGAYFSVLLKYEICNAAIRTGSGYWALRKWRDVERFLQVKRVYCNWRTRKYRLTWGKLGEEERREERERERERCCRMAVGWSPLCWMAAFPVPFILRVDRLLTIQIRGFEMADSRIWKKLKRPATSLAALAPASQGVPFSGRSLSVEWRGTPIWMWRGWRTGPGAGWARDKRGLDDDDASQECAWARAGGERPGGPLHPSLLSFGPPGPNVEWWIGNSWANRRHFKQIWCSCKHVLC